MNLAAEYNNRALVPDHPSIIEGWRREAAAYRAVAPGEFDIPYGARLRNRVDIFRPQSESAAAAIVFIHGGYWRSFDKSLFSHMAKGAVVHGATVAVPSYTLCPETSVPGIIDELRQCLLFLHRRLGRPLVVAGHSAGGHLAACMAASDWTAYGVPPAMVSSGLSVSGLFDLRPLLATPVNDDIHLTPVTAAAASPLLWPVPRRLRFESWVGADESPEFLRQSRSLAAAWTGLGLDVPHIEVEGANHFTVPAPLADPESNMVAHLVRLAQT